MHMHTHTHTETLPQTHNHHTHVQTRTAACTPAAFYRGQTRRGLVAVQRFCHRSCEP